SSNIAGCGIIQCRTALGRGFGGTETGEHNELSLELCHCPRNTCDLVWFSFNSECFELVLQSSNSGLIKSGGDNDRSVVCGLNAQQQGFGLFKRRGGCQLSGEFRDEISGSGILSHEITSFECLAE